MCPVSDEMQNIFLEMTFETSKFIIKCLQINQLNELKFELNKILMRNNTGQNRNIKRQGEFLSLFLL